MSIAIVTILAAWLAVVSAWQPCSNGSTASRLCMISDARRPLMGGNWKLNPTTVDAAIKLTKDLQHLQGSRIQLGAQDVFYESSGAFTGAVSTHLLKEVGSSYVLVGHSERRTIFMESDATINRKVKKVLQAGLKPVLCIGESKAEYEAGLNQQVCAIQLLKGLQDVTPEEMLDVVIAYEPVWAIGTGLVCPKEVAQEVHAFIRSIIAKKYGPEIARRTIIQYGGSVNVGNVKELMAQPDIDGCLVGGASLTAESFAKIIGFEKL